MENSSINPNLIRLRDSQNDDDTSKRPNKRPKIEETIDFQKIIPDLNTQDNNSYNQLNFNISNKNYFTQSISSIVFEYLDLVETIAYNLHPRDLLTLRTTSTYCKTAVNSGLINMLNHGKLVLNQIGIRTVDSAIAFFGKFSTTITNLDLTEFKNITDQDIEKISIHFPKLQKLSLKNALITTESKPFFANMRSLRSLDLSGCKKMNDISFVGECKQLTSLSLDLSGRDFEDLSFIAECKQLTNLILDLSWCGNVKDLSFLVKCQLLTKFSLNLEGCEKINDISFLKTYQNLTTLMLSGILTFKNFDFLTMANYQNLQTLELVGFDINDLSFLTNCQNITELSLSQSKFLPEHLSFLENCPNLKKLNLNQCTSSFLNEHSSFLANFKNLTNLNLAGCKNIKDFNFLEKLQNLISLNLYSTNVSDLSVLANCQNLTDLNLGCCHNLHDLNFLTNHKNLKKLNLYDCSHIKELDLLANCPNLTELILEGCLQIYDFSFLKNHQNLCHLNLCGCEKIDNLSFLENHQNLCHLDLSGCEQIDDLSILASCQSLTQILLPNEDEYNLPKDLNEFYEAIKPDVSEIEVDIQIDNPSTFPEGDYAQNDLGYRKQFGINTEVDPEGAVRLYTLSAVQGNAYARYNLGICKQFGIGTRVDLEGAFWLYTLAANQGHFYAQEALKSLQPARF